MTMRRTPPLYFLKIFVALLTVQLYGCSPTWPHAYDTLRPVFNAHGRGLVLLGVLDKRNWTKEIVEFQAKVGTTRSVTGEVWDIHTESGAPLSQDLVKSICGALVENGFECGLLNHPNRSPSQIGEELSSRAAWRAVRLRINAWNIETYLTSKVTYDLQLDVVDNAGVLKAIVQMRGEDVLGVEVPNNPARNASVRAPRALEARLGDLLNHEQVVRALSQVPPNSYLGG